MLLLCVVFGIIYLFIYFFLVFYFFVDFSMSVAHYSYSSYFRCLICMHTNNGNTNTKMCLFRFPHFTSFIGFIIYVLCLFSSKTTSDHWLYIYINRNRLRCNTFWQEESKKKNKELYFSIDAHLAPLNVDERVVVYFVIIFYLFIFFSNQ